MLCGCGYLFYAWTLAPGSLPSTFDRSTPVKALTAGGICPTRRAMSAVVLSLPPMRTISSVLANGAATSAAILNGGNYYLLQTELN